MRKEKPSRKTRSRVAAEILEGLTELDRAVRDRIPLDQKFTVRTVELVLKPKGMDSEEIRLLRLGLKVSQAVFAAVLGVSVDLVQAWEQGRRDPSDSMLRMMHIFNDNPKLFMKQIQLKIGPQGV
jgi:putative transcriptional regulator